MAGKNEASIDIFLRVRPVAKSSNRLAVDHSENKVEFNIPRDLAAGYVNNNREHYEFRFNGVIEPEAKQDEVFERVARGVVTGALEGYNGTIFAYGQTGSGKTFTITGGPERYVDRGIIPRAISAIFSDVTKRGDYQYQVHISYLEIYNETGYDLLDPDREVKAMEDLPQVFFMEDEDHNIQFRNLSVHRANNEEEALNLLFLGDTNRTISETPMNMASSRSHCIFTIYVEARKSGEDVVRRSKLNLVDLAGSERVSKTGVDGTTLKEAKYINLSLHYLEQVIIALQEKSAGKSRPHIPYRNSMMTMALKDSLGGNCKTTMVATINPSLEQLDESISTCRFALRVAMVRNTVEVNEEMDPTLVIRRLKQEIRDLKEELRMIKGEDAERGPLTPDEVKRLQDQIEAYCKDNSGEASLNLGGSMMMIKAAFDVFRNMVMSGGLLALPKGDGTAAGAKAVVVAGAGAVGELQETIKKLKLQVQQRDNEINILVSMLKRREGGGGPQLGPAAPGPAPIGPAPSAGGTPSSSMDRPPGAAWPAGVSTSMQASGGQPSSSASGSVRSSQQGLGAGPGGGGGGGGGDEMSMLLDANLLADRNKAFELFRKSYRQNEVIEENKALLKQKVEVAKGLGTSVNDSKNKINELKALIEQRRLQRALAGEDLQAQTDPEEERCKDMIEKEKARYKDAFNQLRELKNEIDHLKLLLEQSRARLQKDFVQWMGLMSRQAGADGMPNGMPSSPMAPAVPMPQMPTPPTGMPQMVAAAMPVPRSPAPAPTPSSGMGTPPPVPRQAWGEPAASPVAYARPPQPTAMAMPSPQVLSYPGVSPAVMQQAMPHLTGNPQADLDIIRFYEAKAKLVQSLS